MLDGKYEITSERELGTRMTLFGATAPDGTMLQINWYDLNSADEERAFERYRTLLRKLRREGHAAVYDLVSRPGAYYVAWRVPQTAGAPTSLQLEPIEALLQAHGRMLGEAHICAEAGAPPQIFALPFESVPHGGAVVVTPLPSPTEGVDNRWKRLSERLWERLWERFRPWTLGIVLALGGVLLLLLSAQRLLQSDLISVPEVRGQEINEALMTLYRTGFSTSSVALVSPQPSGTVIEVRPPVGTLLRPGRTLSVSYALRAGLAPETVPQVTGKTLATAKAALLQTGFSVGGIARVYSAAEGGTVIAQTPPGNAQAAQGSRVGLLLSSGPRGARTFLPELTGLNLADALTLAEAAGFAREEVRLEHTSGGGVAAGTVLAQNIAPFLSVPQTAQLRLTVAESSTSAAGESGTPDLIGLSLTEAQRLARSSGLSVTQEARVSTSELPAGVVLQEPAPGAPLQGGLTVTLNVPPKPPQAKPAPEAVRRAEYSWQLGSDSAGKKATVTVTDESGTTEVLLRGQKVRARERVAGLYLTTASGSLTFRLTLDGAPFGEPLRVNP